MTEKVQSPSRTRLDFLRQIKGLRILAMLAILVGLVTALGLSRTVQTSSAVVKNAENAALPEPQETPPACATIPPENCVPNPNGEGTICCNTDNATGDRTCRFQTESCQVFENPCDPDNPVFASVRTTLITHSHTDRRGGRHFRTHLEIHGRGITQEELAVCNPDLAASLANKGIHSHGVAFVKASTTQGGEIITLVKNSGFNSSGPPPETFSDPFTLHIITPGPAANAAFHLVLHFTENANGEMTACTSRERTTCQGQPQTQ